METREKEDNRIVPLGLIYSVERHRFEMIYKDPVTHRIRIGLSDDQEGEEAPTSTGAA